MRLEGIKMGATIGDRLDDMAIIKELAEGKRRREIAEALGCSDVTIFNRLQRLYNQFEARTDAQLVIKAYQSGVIKLDSMASS
jgi:DNA-binding NarL/FixJ family response regulator